MVSPVTDHRVPAFRREALHRRRVLDAGVVHQDVDGTQFFFRGGDHLAGQGRQWLRATSVVFLASGRRRAAAVVPSLLTRVAKPQAVFNPCELIDCSWHHPLAHRIEGIRRDMQ
jgi:hypothetical protein